MLIDRYGMELSTASPTACAHYIAGVDLMLANQHGADELFRLALASDPGFAMAHAALARHCQMWGRAADAKTAIAGAQTHAATLSRREQQHIALLATLINGNAAQGLRMLLDHLDDFPRDAIALGTALGAFGLLAFSGRPDHDAVRLALSERLADAYGDDWWFLGYLGWAHVEAGSLVAGERHIERSLALRADNANAIHAFAHLAYEQGRASDAIERLDALTVDYGVHALLHNHLRWHAALGALGAGKFEAALTAYDRYLAPDVATAPLITALSDAVSLLWRVELATGRPCGGGRWEALGDFVRAKNYQSTVAFLDLHIAALHCATHDTAAFDALLVQLKGAFDAGRLPAGPAVMALCEALRAYAEGKPQAAADLLDASLGNIVRIGGSGAQRDIFEETLAAARVLLGDVAAGSRFATWQKVRSSSLIQA